jgi:methylenetetrahydrofolate dehydrogenase (NADP+)/methenyltetrahydrofolate cyclohydrolase/formyltetrahydrofolate synthetase
VGDRSDSSTYVRMKLKAAVEANIDCELVQLPEDTSESDLLHRVYQYNNGTASSSSCRCPSTSPSTRLPAP